MMAINQEHDSSKRMMMTVLYHDGCSWQGAVPHLRQEDSGCKEDKYNLWAPTCHEKWKAWAGIQADSKDDQTGQREIADPRQQLPVLRKSELAYHAMLVKIGVHHYKTGESSGISQIKTLKQDTLGNLFRVTVSEKRSWDLAEVGLTPEHTALTHTLWDKLIEFPTVNGDATLHIVT
ncbi:hypothetical protein U0070_022308 [Myodes glareolus]|uniref:Uncharacterized protein n=1 Tax=Myodes glareolus TaxID=447135 RepID=A0AAW0IB52_MYOGA